MSKIWRLHRLILFTSIAYATTKKCKSRSLTTRRLLLPRVENMHPHTTLALFLEKTPALLGTICQTFYSVS